MKVVKSLENSGVLLTGTTRKIVEKEDFLIFFKPLRTPGLPLMKNVHTPLDKIVLVPLGLTAVASATDADIQNKFFGSGTTPVFSNEELDNIIKIVKSLKDAGLLIKGVNKNVDNEVKEQKQRFISMLASTLDASLLSNVLTGKLLIPAGEGIIRASQDFLMPHHPLTNF